MAVSVGRGIGRETAWRNVSMGWDGTGRDMRKVEGEGNSELAVGSEPYQKKSRTISRFLEAEPRSIGLDTICG